MLPGALTRNSGLRFINRDVRITITGNQTRWTSGYSAGEQLTVVLKSGEGAYAADPATLASLDAQGLVIARYANGSPNGSTGDIAGIASPDGGIVGLMPHPEHAIDQLTGPSADGLGFFTSILSSVAA